MKPLPTHRTAPSLLLIVASMLIAKAALTDHYAYRELQHLTDNIGPRLSGSAQAAKAVEYVAAEMCALGAAVTLEKTRVPHWIRGIETASLVSWSGMAPQTTQKIVLTALGGSVATPPNGITAPDEESGSEGAVVRPDYLDRGTKGTTS